jgi:hypothetical protein
MVQWFGGNFTPVREYSGTAKNQQMRHNYVAVMTATWQQ